MDLNHPIAKCPDMAALHGSADMIDATGIFEEEHEFVGKDTKKKSLAWVFRSFGKRESRE